MVCSKM